jgi:diacylglycerol kinase (ATP)
MMTMEKKEGFSRIVAAFTYSMAGLREAARSERAFQQELILFIPAMILVFFLQVSLLEKISLWSVCILVLMVELLNSAIEAVVDRISLEHHVLSKHAKDFGSAAVFLALLVCGLVWGGVVIPLFF